MFYCLSVIVFQNAIPHGYFQLAFCVFGGRSAFCYICLLEALCMFQVDISKKEMIIVICCFVFLCYNIKSFCDCPLGILHLVKYCRAQSKNVMVFSF